MLVMMTTKSISGCVSKSSRSPGFTRTVPVSAPSSSWRGNAGEDFSTSAKLQIETPPIRPHDEINSIDYINDNAPTMDSTEYYFRFHEVVDYTPAKSWGTSWCSKWRKRARRDSNRKLPRKTVRILLPVTQASLLDDKGSWIQLAWCRFFKGVELVMSSTPDIQHITDHVLRDLHLPQRADITPNPKRHFRSAAWHTLHVDSHPARIAPVKSVVSVHLELIISPPPPLFHRRIPEVEFSRRGVDIEVCDFAAIDVIGQRVAVCVERCHAQARFRSSFIIKPEVVFGAVHCRRVIVDVVDVDAKSRRSGGRGTSCRSDNGQMILRFRKICRIICVNIRLFFVVNQVTEVDPIQSEDHGQMILRLSLIVEFY